MSAVGSWAKETGGTLTDSLAAAVGEAVNPLKLQSHAERAPAPPPGEKPPPPPPPNPARAVAQAGGAVMGLLSLPLEVLNTGVAVVTAPLAAIYPSMPAATLGSLYVAPPHGHLHPPSFTPPVTPAPVPLPSLGPVILGTTIKVLVNGLPAARAGDIGLAATCVGFCPMFEIFTGSSNVFIAGMRAARVGDIAKACLPSTSGPIRGMAAAMRNAGIAVGVLGIAADATDAAQEADPAMAAASAMAAAVDAASMALDAATTAISQAMGKDMAVPPTFGALITGSFTVLVGGFPMPNIPDPVQKLLEKLGKRRKGKKREAKDDDADGTASCTTCSRQGG